MLKKAGLFRRFFIPVEQILLPKKATLFEQISTKLAFLFKYNNKKEQNASFSQKYKKKTFDTSLWSILI